MAGKILNYYAGGNTARGFHNLFESNLSGLERLFILKGGPGTGKSTLMKAIGKKWNDIGYDVEYIHCASDNGSIDGVILRALKVGIVDGTSPHVIEPKAPGALEEYVNLGAAWNSVQLAETKDEIIKLSDSISGDFATAYSIFHEALLVHDEWEKIYIENMDYSKADELTDELIETFFAKKINRQANVFHRFLGAATPQGAVDHVPNLTEGLKERFFIKGRPGSGKSTLLKKLASEAEKSGYDVEVYHCGFDPNSLDMIIVRELSFAIFDSTAPHEYFPERAGDSIIDMYAKTITPGTDEKHAAELKEISGRYADKMKEAISFLAEAKRKHDDLENYYIGAMDFNKIAEIQKQLDQEIEKLAVARQK
ncbi:PRK06851 family protein [Fictibacillus barbaricus]|uniref:DNA replication protein DnaC n=1 Tax=Fictibacillus barbaricus TaxID=182136 RepID=A0ABU1U4J0_9BACL|nr:PRK06851 family protein [Fictibacillus barbaricus]MDR7074387.1 DNA replication protein DnaC [Fictibacillus barbaricus]